MRTKNFIKYSLIIATFSIISLAAWFFYSDDFVEIKIRNVLLISIDTCRADYLSCYGYPRRTTANIDEVAKEGFLFENAITPIPITLPAHSSMLTGTSPLYHRIHDNIGYKLSSRNITLAELLKKQNYKTGAIVSSFVLDSQFGLDQGFDTYNDSFEKEITTGNFSERKGEETSRFANKWLESHKDENFFLFLHYYDPHHRYEPPQPFASEFENNLYAGEIAYTDYCIGRVIDKLKELKLWESTLIVIVGDHGEMLGEHGEAEHGYFIYQSAIKVPLIFKLPGNSKPKRIKSLVSINDIVPTVCSLLGIQPSEHLIGKDLSRCFSGKKTCAQKRFLYCESIIPTKHNANALLGIVTERYKYIQTTRPELYDLIGDPEETNNLTSKEPQRAHLLREQLRLMLEEQEQLSGSTEGGRLQLDEESRKRLESLGYIAGGKSDDSLGFDQSKPDPKDFIKFHNIKAYNEMAISLINEGKLEQAVRALEEIILHYNKARIQHSMGKIHCNLAVALQRLGRLQQAKKHFNKTVKLFREELDYRPNDVTLWIVIGNTLAMMGNFKGASESFEQAVSLEPDNLAAYSDLAKALEFQGRYREAIGATIKQIELLRKTNKKQSLAELQTYLEFLQKQSEKR